MKPINEVRISGRAGRDAEVKYVGANSTKVANFSVAHGGGRRKDGNGDWPTHWFTVKAWKGVADQAEYVRKGAEVLVTGRLEVESWTDKQTGQKREKTVIVASDISFEGRELEPITPAYEPTLASQAVTPEHPITDMDIPF